MLIINTATLSVYASVVLQIFLGGGGVESIEALSLAGAALSTALLISFRFIDFEFSSKPTRKSNKIHSSELINA